MCNLEQVQNGELQTFYLRFMLVTFFFPAMAIRCYICDGPIDMSDLENPKCTSKQPIECSEMGQDACLTMETTVESSYGTVNTRVMVGCAMKLNTVPKQYTWPAPICKRCSTLQRFTQVRGCRWRNVPGNVAPQTCVINHQSGRRRWEPVSRKSRILAPFSRPRCRLSCSPSGCWETTECTAGFHSCRSWKLISSWF